jgi:hypothetical protein
MQKPVGKIFIAAVLGVALALTGNALFSDKQPAAQTAEVERAPQPAAIASPAPASQPAATTEDPRVAGFQEGYRAGYQDAQRDCAVAANAAPAPRYQRSSYSSGRTRVVRVAGQRYYNEGRRGHSTRNMILRIAAPAAIGAGIGAIAGGGKGAGAGALIGGGAGAIYHLIKTR